MYNNNRANQYKAMSVTTASREQVLLMLYEAAIRHCKKAMEGIEKKDMAMKGQSIVKVHDIVNELLNTLDFNVGGDIARNLERLYNFIISELVKANIENDIPTLMGIQKILENLYEGWKTAVQQLGQGKANGIAKPSAE